MKDVLIVGSANYIEDWYNKNAEIVENYDEIYCLNTASLIIKNPHIWSVSTNFFQSNKYKTEVQFRDINKQYVKKELKTFIKTPKWYDGNDTMFLNTAYHIDNLYERDVNIFAIGCDFDYSSNATHFYGKGTPDPLRKGKEKLLKQLEQMKKDLRITNLSNNINSLW